MTKMTGHEACERTLEDVRVEFKKTFMEREQLRREVEGLAKQLRLANEDREHAFDQMRKANEHSARLLRAVQAWRSAERELYAVCAEVGSLPDADKGGPSRFNQEWFGEAIGRIESQFGSASEKAGGGR